MVPPGRVRLHVYEIKWIRKSLEDDLGTTLEVNIPKQITNVEENTKSALPQRTENRTSVSIVDQRHDMEGAHRSFFRRFFLNELDTSSTIWSGVKRNLQPHYNCHGLKDTTNIKNKARIRKNNVGMYPRQPYMVWPGCATSVVAHVFVQKKLIFRRTLSAYYIYLYIYMCALVETNISQNTTRYPYSGFLL